METFNLFDVTAYTDERIDNDTALRVAELLAQAVAGVLRSEGIASGTAIVALAYDVTAESVEYSNEEKNLVGVRTALA